MTLQDRHIQLTLYDLAYDTAKRVRFPECGIMMINADRNHNDTTYCEVATLDSDDYGVISLKQTVTIPLVKRKNNITIPTMARRL